MASPEAGGGRRRRAAGLYAVIRLLVFSAVIVYLVVQIASGWPAIAAVTVKWDAASLALAFGSGLLAYQCLFGGWLILLRRVGYFRARHLGVYSRVWWISYLYRYVPGKVMLLVERARMGTAVGIPPAAGAALAVIETLLAILAAGWMSLLAVSFYAGNTRWFLWVVVPLSVVVLFLLPAAYRLFCTRPGVRRRFPALEAVALGPVDILVAMPAFVGHFVFLGLSFFLCARALEPFPWSALPGLTGIYALAHVVGLVTMIAPGGLGVREGTLAVQLGRVLPGGVAEAAAVGARLWFTLIELTSLAAVLLLSPRLPQSAAAGAAELEAEPE
ncbi:MAG: hypothetical protein ACYS0G_08310 [Planctomycetota bacterium]|jgi:hypothetical protein